MNRHDRANLQQLEWLREALKTELAAKPQTHPDQPSKGQQEGPPQTAFPEALDLETHQQG